MLSYLPANERTRISPFTETNNSRQDFNTAVDTPWFPIDYDCLILQRQTAYFVNS